MSRILILTSGPLCRNPRVLKEATALGHAGHKVTVLTVAYNAAEEAEDALLLTHAPFNKEIVDLVPGPGLSRPCRRLVRRASGLLARKLLRTGLFNAHTLGPFTSLERRARRLNWDLLIAHTELPMVIACRFLAEGRPVAADIEDWHSRDLLSSAARYRPVKLLIETERRLLQHALVTTTTSEAMAGKLHAAYGGLRPAVVRNVFPLQPAPASRPPDTMPSFFWFSQTTGPGRGLEAFISAWTRTHRPSRLVLLGNVSPDYRATLTGLISPERQNRVSFLSLVHPDTLPSVIAEHTIGLALEAFDPDNRNLTISNKTFQYFNAGLAVLATGTEGQREAAAHAPGACMIIDLGDPSRLASELDALLAEPERIAAMGTAARVAAVNELCWEHESVRLVSAIESALLKTAQASPS